MRRDLTIAVLTRRPGSVDTLIAASVSTFDLLQLGSRRTALRARDVRRPGQSKIGNFLQRVGRFSDAAEAGKADASSMTSAEDRDSLKSEISYKE